MTGISKLRAAIVGCGRIAGGYDEHSGPRKVQTHARAYQLEPSTDLVSVADVDIQRAREFSIRWAYPAVYDDVPQMLAVEHPDIVSVCTPDESHATILEMCLDSPSVKAVWCEKPLTTDVETAERIVKIYAQRGILLAVNYQRRWQPHMERIKEALQKRDLGKIQKVVVYYSKGVCHNGSHAIDLLLDWFGPVDSLSVHRCLVGFDARDPTVDASLQFGGVTAYLIGVDHNAYELFEIHVLGTSGRVTVNSSTQGIEWYRVGQDPQFEGYQVLNLEDRWVHTAEECVMASVLQDIVESVSTRQEVRSNGESALATLRVCRALATQSPSS